VQGIYLQQGLKIRKRMKKILYVLLICIPTILVAQDEEILREESTLTLDIDASNQYVTEVPVSGYLLDDNSVQIYTGETVFIEVELKKKKIEGMKVVSENVNPDKTLVFYFSQKTKGKLHQAMILRITNPFPYKITYSSERFAIDELWKSLPTQVIEPNFVTTEVWDDIIVNIILSDFKFK